MLELGNFNLKFFFSGPGYLVFKSFPAAILKASLAFLFELFLPIGKLAGS